MLIFSHACKGAKKTYVDLLTTMDQLVAIMLSVSSSPLPLPALKTFALKIKDLNERGRRDHLTKNNNKESGTKTLSVPQKECFNEIII